jgi:hypothetical protein
VKMPSWIQRRRWWALVNHTSDLPVVFRTREQAESEAEPDEMLVRIEVQMMHEPKPIRRRKAQGK